MAKKRKGLSKKTRFDVFKRDGFKCQYCGRTPPQIILQVDHIIAVASGGGDDDTNLLTSCEDCNSGKGARDLSQAPESVQEVMRKKREKVEQANAFNEFLVDMRQEEDNWTGLLGRYWFNLIYTEQDKYIFGPSRARSIRVFLKNLLPIEIEDAIGLAHSKFPATPENDERTWKYFCGICWKTIKGKAGPQS